MTSNVVNLITKLLLPPIFLLRYGTTLYGEWIALSGAVAYLSTLNFGIQTYVTQDLTVRYQRNDMEQYHLQQSTSLRVLLGILGSAAVVCLVVFALPVQNWLRLTLSQRVTDLTLYLLALQVLLGVLFGYFTGMYMVLSRAHAGVLWTNGLRLTVVLVVSAGVWMRLSFPALASMQVGVYLLGTALVLLHLRRAAQEIFPRIGLWDRGAVAAILRPSSYFGLISMSTFLSYELPVLILQREAGPFVVVAFTAMRTIFSMSRLALVNPTLALGPEITRLYGLRDWRKLTEIYRYSERLIYALIPVVNLGVLIVSPVLLAVWLHLPGLFSVLPYVITAAISMVLSAKQLKFQFQCSTNTHEQLGRIMFTSYIALGLITAPMVHWLGMLGFLYAWLGVEVYQFIRLIGLNQRLFEGTQAHSLSPLYRLTVVSVGGTVIAGYILAHTCTRPYSTQFAAAIGTAVVLAVISFFLFNIRGIATAFYALFRRRLIADDGEV
ncbi:MAG: hypothetical protein WA708_08375 [Acidobacteriaceae bacterium]